jgi:hypothetical protein
MALLTAVVLLIVFSTPAKAYIDPGSGSYMLQILLAGFLAFIYSVKLSWKRIKTAAANYVSNNRRTGTRGEA